MSEDRTDTPEPEATDIDATAAPDGPDAGVAWREVVAQIEALGEAIGQWAKAAVKDPDNKRRVAELREKLDGLGDKIGDAVEGASESEAAQKVKEAAGKAGDAIKDFGEKVGDEVAPKMASAFSAAADKLRGAAERMEDKIRGDDDEEASPDVDDGAEQDVIHE